MLQAVSFAKNKERESPRTHEVVIIYLGDVLPRHSSNLPECVTGRHNALLCGLAPGGVYLADASSHRWCALTAPLHPCLCAHVRAPSAVIMSVALSLGLLPLGVTQHPARWSSDFPPARPFGTAPAITLITSSKIY